MTSRDELITTEMIERVAIVLRENSLDGRWDDPNWEIMARAAIEAMREPTDEMYEAGWHGTVYLEDSNPSAVWQAMIDAALAKIGKTKASFREKI